MYDKNIPYNKYVNIKYDKLSPQLRDYIYNIINNATIKDLHSGELKSIIRAYLRYTMKEKYGTAGSRYKENFDIWLNEIISVCHKQDSNNMYYKLKCITNDKDVSTTYYIPVDSFEERHEITEYIALLVYLLDFGIAFDEIPSKGRE